MSKCKVAIFQYDLGVGGIQKSLINLLNAIDEKKYDIDLFLFSKEDFYETSLPKFVTVNYIHSFPSWMKILPFRIAKRFAHKLNDTIYDVAIDFNSYQNECAAFALLCNANRHIIWCHNDVKIKQKNEARYRYLWLMMKSKFYFFDNICIVSKGAKKSFVEVTGIEEKKVHVLPNIINTDEIFQYKNQVNSIEVDNNKYNLITVGRISHQKGLDILVELFGKVVEKRKDIHLYIVGDGDDKKKLIEEVQKLKLNNFVTFTGYLKNPFSLMNNMDGFILTSRYEGQGMVLLEAKSLGLDVFIPKHLEQYVDNISGQVDLINSLLNASKNAIKRYDDLSTYNNSIIEKFDQLCTEETNYE
ncbi:glycosyltransferase involved in cell wall biosynthesis [Breznakia blatticola]|uniref:Glycosyltransferase involved in cell wall biosynthesis n=1 Tax=Breznakia blatticola TaxID=1754012 RepID=A0A4R7ZAZ5_9FIRM|nr:glycosyltransferase [Breznakia blatticola]TDW13956.1 glycosyltransferase involved in cell wall biosynthesis [Breznakia blatticola]